MIKKDDLWPLNQNRIDGRYTTQCTPIFKDPKSETGEEIKSGWVFNMAKQHAISMAKQWPEVPGWEPPSNLAGLIYQIGDMQRNMKRVFTCVNTECDWTGLRRDTVMLGSIGPLCPCCREIAE